MAVFSISGILILLNLIISYRGFRDRGFFDRYSFIVDAVARQKDYKRLFTAGFLHVNWMHLIFNMLALYFFGSSMEAYLGGAEYLLIYVAGLLGGNLLSLTIHKFNSSYSTVGASGAV